MRNQVYCLILITLLLTSHGWSQPRRQPPVNRQPKFSIEPEVLAQQSDQELLDLMTKCRRQQFPIHGVSVGEMLLDRDLTADMRVKVLLTLAQTYEAINGDWVGPEVRRSYQRILDEYPDAACADKVALRLGELYDHIIKEGTEPDPNLAEKYFKRVIDRYQQDRRPDKTTDMVVLRAYIHLGNLYARQRKMDTSNACYQAIYDCDPNRVSMGNRKPKEVLLEFAALRQVVARHLVNNCIRSKSEDTLAQFDRLEQQYAEDTELMKFIYVRRQDCLDRINAFPKDLQEKVQPEHQ